MPVTTPSLRELAFALAREKKIELADAQAIVFAAARAQASRDDLAPPPGVIRGSAEHLRILNAQAGATSGGAPPGSAPGAAPVRLPPLRVLAVALAREKGIALADAQALIYAATQRLRRATP